MYLPTPRSNVTVSYADAEPNGLAALVGLIALLMYNFQDLTPGISVVFPGAAALTGVLLMVLTLIFVLILRAIGKKTGEQVNLI